MKRWFIVDDEDPSFKVDITCEVGEFRLVQDVLRQYPELIYHVLIGATMWRTLYAIQKSGRS